MPFWLATKWNFLPFKPGLVGGHCIGVDPYYLAQRAQEFGYHPRNYFSRSSFETVWRIRSFPSGEAND
jgi:hypothetical protein